MNLADPNMEHGDIGPCHVRNPARQVRPVDELFAQHPDLLGFHIDVLRAHPSSPIVGLGCCACVAGSQIDIATAHVARVKRMLANRNGPCDAV